MSCPNENSCELRKMIAEDKAICLKCGCQFRIEKVEPEFSVGAVLFTLVFLAILFNLVIAPKQLYSAPYASDSAEAEVNFAK